MIKNPNWFFLFRYVIKMICSFSEGKRSFWNFEAIERVPRRTFVGKKLFDGSYSMVFRSRNQFFRHPVLLSFLFILCETIHLHWSWFFFISCDFIHISIVSFCVICYQSSIWELTNTCAHLAFGYSGSWLFSCCSCSVVVVVQSSLSFVEIAVIVQLQLFPVWCLGLWTGWTHYGAEWFTRRRDYTSYFHRIARKKINRL